MKGIGWVTTTLTFGVMGANIFGLCGRLTTAVTLRYAIPEANPSLYFGMSLGITFPLNILLGIPFYTSVAAAVLG
jgi:hypothetical protein